MFDAWARNSRRKRSRLRRSRQWPALETLVVALALLPAASAADFMRGDVDRDGRINLSDPVNVILSLFTGASPLGCEDAADSNDDGKLDIADPLHLLGYLFRQGDVPAPGPVVPGPDPTCDQLGCADAPPASGAIVISEIHYHPEHDFEREYIELQNRTAFDVDLSTYALTAGVRFEFPPGTIAPAHGFVVVARRPDRHSDLVPAAAGPYTGFLANGGERVTLMDGVCRVESVRYDDRPPWPVGADGYGPSLERVSVTAPAADPHSWRAAISAEPGPVRPTPGAPNSTAGTPTHPFAIAWRHDPPHPRSTDAVSVDVELDIAAAEIVGAELVWQTFGAQASSAARTTFEVTSAGGTVTTLSAHLPPQPSQTLVRCVVDLELQSGKRVRLPHLGEPRPFSSYFVYDLDVAATLPLIWRFSLAETDLTPAGKLYSGVSIWEVDGPHAQLFDGANVRPRIDVATNGHKIRFVKGEEYAGNRIFNVFPEINSALEHFGFTTFEIAGALAPSARWYRFIEFKADGLAHTHHLVLQQVNENFLALAGLNDDGDLYKLTGRASKVTNLESGTAVWDDLFLRLRSPDPAIKRAAISEFDLANVGLYSAVEVFIANWDGFHNNLFIHSDLTPPGTSGGWRVIPWDLDSAYQPRNWDMPLSFPLTGRPETTSSFQFTRPPGTVSKPFHQQPDFDAAYRSKMKSLVAPGGKLSTEVLLARADDLEALVLEDLALSEAQLGAERPAWRSRIRSTYASLRTFVSDRVSFLRGELSATPDANE